MSDVLAVGYIGLFPFYRRTVIVTVKSSRSQKCNEINNTINFCVDFLSLSVLYIAFGVACNWVGD